MTLHTLNSQNTVLNKFIAQIRDKSIQTDSMRFRRNLERIGEITAYEISKELSYTPRVVETPLGEATVETIDDLPSGFSELLRRCGERVCFGLP